MRKENFRFFSIDYNLNNHTQKSQYNNLLAENEFYLKIKDFLLESSSHYLNIDKWWEKSVKPGLKSGERFCQIVMADDKLVGLSIGKRSNTSAKLCTLKVREKYRGYGFGEKLLKTTLSKLLESRCKKVHFTINEQIQEECGKFFSHFGFNLLSWQKNRYSHGMEELVFSAKVNQLRLRLQTYLKPKMKNRLVLLSIKPEYATLIEKGKKEVEFRRRFSSCFDNYTAVFYVSSPAKEIRFTANIWNVVRSTPDSLWKQFYEKGGINRDPFMDYFSCSKEGCALLLSDIQPLPEIIHLTDSRLKKIGFKPPQSYSFIKPESLIFRVLPYLRSSIGE